MCDCRSPQCWWTYIRNLKQAKHDKQSMANQFQLSILQSADGGYLIEQYIFSWFIIMNSGMQGVTIFLSFIVLTSFLLWVMVGPKCLIQTHVNLIYGRQWSNQTYISTNETNGLNPEKQLFKAEESMSSSRICKPKHKVTFAKTHKTGGTSIQV